MTDRAALGLLESRSYRRADAHGVAIWSCLLRPRRRRLVLFTAPGASPHVQLFEVAGQRHRLWLWLDLPLVNEVLRRCGSFVLILKFAGERGCSISFSGDGNPGVLLSISCYFYDHLATSSGGSCHYCSSRRPDGWCSHMASLCSGTQVALCPR